MKFLRSPLFPILVFILVEFSFFAWGFYHTNFLFDYACPTCVGCPCDPPENPFYSYFLNPYLSDRIQNGSFFASKFVIPSMVFVILLYSAILKLSKK